MEKILEGRGASAGESIGIVRIVKNKEDFYTFKKGEVLVTEMTDPSMIVIMGKANAIITDFGGMACHAAIVSREMGIPAVVGTENATQKLKDGMKIKINGNSGEVFLIENGEWYWWIY